MDLENLSAEEMAAIDENADYLGVPRALLMENAGRSVADCVKSRLNVTNKRIVVFAGLGNKGGDGFVAARHLAVAGAKVTVLLLGEEGRIATSEARLNWNALKNMDHTVKLITVKDSIALESIASSLEGVDVTIDALVGTGLRGPLRGLALSAVKLMNGLKGLKVAIDIPTGLDAADGRVHGEAFKADLTVTMHKPKKGLLENRSYVGELIVADIGIPKEAELYAGPGDIRLIVKPRKPQTHKYDYGCVLVIGGSKFYSGAPALAALAALKAGVGLTVVATPEVVANVVRSYSPNLIVRPLKGDLLTLKNVSEAAQAMDRADSIVVGPGLGIEEETFEAFEVVVKEALKRELPILIDADGLKALAVKKCKLSSNLSVITPHFAEFKQLTGVEPPQDRGQRMEVAIKAATDFKATLVLKGHETIITDGVRVKVNKTGNPGMAVGGTGDVLSGLIAAFLAQGVEPFKASVAGAFINGLAGDLAAKEKGYQLLATDLLEKIPIILRRFQPWVEEYVERVKRLKLDV
ncbi:MAG: NAD(P)H-hydrate dehydratase [Candidatus Nezhaarchaeales archaeon]